MALFSGFVLAFLAPYCLASDALVGGIQERKTDDPDVLDALDFAMNEFNSLQNNMYRLMATKIGDATFQVKRKLKNNFPGFVVGISPHDQGQSYRFCLLFF